MMPQIYQILGTVKHVKRNPGEDKGSVIRLIDYATQKEVKVNCPFFCPTKKDDIIAGAAILANDNTLTFAQCPMVEPPSSKEAVQNVFIIGMGKLRMSQQMADKVYDFFKDEAIERLKTRPKIIDKGSSESTIFRNCDSLNAAVIETISWYANSFRTDEFTAQPLINLGLAKEQAHQLLQSWYRSYCLRRLYLLGLTRKEIRECCDRGWAGTNGVVNSPDALYYQLIENPFIPEKIPVEKAKDIACRYGQTFGQDIVECADLIRYVDEQTSKNGSVCFPVFQLIRRYPRFNELIEILKTQFKCTIRYNFFYLRHQAEIEDNLTYYLKPEPLPETHASDMTKLVFCEEQIQAIEMALNNSVCLITGPGGSGKTKIISGIVNELDMREIPWCIGSFTGKAIANVKKVVRKTGNIMTLHMILNQGKIVDSFNRPVRVLIIDEVSMICNELICKVILKLTRALDPEQKLQIILVGDPNQLQPIESGDFTNQIISSLSLPWIQLSVDHRRKKKDGVLFNNMNQFTTAETPEDIDFQWGIDCEFIKGGIVEVENCVRKLWQQGVKSEEFIVLSPINEGLDDINKRVKDIYISPNAPSISDAFGKTWNTGDRIMMTTNRYDIKVMNGEEGVITDVIHGKSCIKVLFENGQEVDIPTFVPVIIENAPDSDEPDYEQPLSTKLITLSWAITVHKSQGSQYKHVIFYLSHKIKGGSFFNRPLLYVGASRAQEELYVIAQHENTFTTAILIDAPKRFDNLSKRLTNEQYVDYYVDPNAERNQQMYREALARAATLT